MLESDSSAIGLLRDNMQLHRVPIIVIGSGVSAGAGVPTMTDIHNYLAERIGSPSSDAAKVAFRLLETLRSDQTVSPRSVSVRLYRLLQTPDDTDMRALWTQFGVDLLAGKVRSSGEALLKVPPTAAHLWAAQLALSERAILVSLNFDGLTRSAVTRFANDNALLREPRILSDEATIRSFFTGEESEESNVTPVPVIKFRGDVFHAVCENGRCPSRGRLQPLYDLLKGDRKNVSDDAAALLRCTECHQGRRLQITFPGIAAKEQDIAHSIRALHEFCGNSIAGVFFLGFSGRWDESLTRYLIGRAKALGGPIVSMGLENTRFIEREAEAAGAQYFFQPADFGNERSAELLRGMVSVDEKIDQYERAPSENTVRFPQEAFRLWQDQEFTIQCPVPADPARKLKIIPAAGSDDFTQIGAEALASPEMTRLERCSQLGLQRYLSSRTQLAVQP